MSFPPATEMFQFAGFASRTYGFSSGYPCGWVAPFGDPGINDRSHLPRAYRSVPRPSSPLSAKASTRCPYDARSPAPASGAEPRHCVSNVEPRHDVSRVGHNPPRTGTKTASCATPLVKTLLPHKADEQLSAVSHRLSASNRDTRLGHTLFTLSKNEPEAVTPGKLQTSAIVARGHP